MKNSCNISPMLYSSQFPGVKIFLMVSRSSRIIFQKFHGFVNVMNISSIDMKVPEGKLVAVVGQVGSGKSSLVAAMLGEMEKLKGKVNVKVHKYESMKLRDTSANCNKNYDKLLLYATANEMTIQH